MNDKRTAAILQRVPQILAVTAASYGLSLDGKDERPRGNAHPRQRGGRGLGPGQGIRKQAKAA